MSRDTIVALSAAGGAVVGVMLGDLLNVAHVFGIVLAGLGGGVGAAAGVNLAGRVGRV